MNDRFRMRTGVGISIMQQPGPAVVPGGAPRPIWEAKITLHRDDVPSEITFEAPDRATVVKRTTEWLRDVL